MLGLSTKGINMMVFVTKLCHFSNSFDCVLVKSTPYDLVLTFSIDVGIIIKPWCTDTVAGLWSWKGPHCRKTMIGYNIVSLPWLRANTDRLCCRCSSHTHIIDVFYLYFIRLYWDLNTHFTCAVIIIGKIRVRNAFFLYSLIIIYNQNFI